MAKRKHSTALFEVIRKSRHYAKPKPASPGAGLLGTARRWLKGSAQAEPASAPEVMPVSRSPVSRSPVSRMAASRMDVDESAGDSSDRVQVNERATGVITGVMDDPAVDRAADHIVALAAAHFDRQEVDRQEADPHADLIAPPPAQNLAVAVDPDRRQISLRVSYTAAIIGAFAILVIVGLCVAIGQHFNHGGAPLLAQTSTDELRKGPAHRDVLNVPRRTTGSVGADAAQGQGQAPPSRGAGIGATENRPAPANDGHVAAPATAADGKRYIGLNYVIVQSYPESERKMAEEAAAFLNEQGVSCTVETGIKDVMKFAVVGLQGFDKVTSPAFKSYEARIKELSTKFAKNNRSFKAFTPMAKKWNKQE